jgi:hypothetical protein
MSELINIFFLSMFISVKYLLCKRLTVSQQENVLANVPTPHTQWTLINKAPNERLLERASTNDP